VSQNGFQLFNCNLTSNLSKVHVTRDSSNPATLAINIQGAAEKSGFLNFLAVFSATVWDFNTKFYSFIY